VSVKPSIHSNFEVQETIRKAAAQVAGGTWPVKFVPPEGGEFYFGRIVTNRDAKTFTVYLDIPKEKDKDVY